MQKIILILTLVFVTNGIKSQTIKSSDFDENLVRSLVYSLEDGFSFSFQTKRNLRLGDRVASAILKVLSEEEILTDQHLSTCLFIIERSFYYPEDIVNKADRTPLKTKLLLKSLIGKTDKQQKINMIENTINKIKKLPDSPLKHGKPLIYDTQLNKDYFKNAYFRERKNSL